MWVHDKILSLSSHELGEKPSTEELAIEGLPPFIVIVFHGIFVLDDCCVRLNTSSIEELLIDFLIGVNVGSSKFIRLTDSLLHLEAIESSKSNIIHENRLNFTIHAFN
jgi:hypothetical protein